MRISVVIPALNAAATIGETLKGLQSQTGAGDFEIIVADNGSSDDTAKIARECGAWVVHEPVRGPAAARNRGLHHARGEIIAHLDADTVPSRRWLSEICEPILAGAVISAGHSICYPPRTPAERYAQAVGLNDAELAVSRTPFPFAPSLNLAVRRDAALAVGGWNVDLITGEDVDFSHRILQKYGGSIAYCKRAIIYHHARSDAAALRRQARSYGAGVADLYRLYPGEVEWNARKALHLTGVLLARAAAPAAASIGRAFGVVDAARAEFTAYHWLWTSNFWMGFAGRAISRRKA